MFEVDKKGRNLKELGIVVGDTSSNRTNFVNMVHYADRAFCVQGCYDPFGA